MLSRNVGTADRIVRCVIGIAALVLAFTMFDVMTGAWAGIIAAVVGVLALGTGLAGVCCLYSVVGLKTCSGAACDAPKK